MGFRFRRSIGILPGVRLNLSRSGPSVSIGARGFHYTVGSKGSRVTAGLPGTGLSWTQYTPHSSNAAISRPVPGVSLAASNDPPPVQIISAPAETLNAVSISELAPILNAAQRRTRFFPFVLFCSIAVLILAFTYGNQLLITVAAIFGAGSIAIAIIVDRYRRSVRITYELEGPAATIAATLKETFADIGGSKAVWSVSSEQRTSDWKRNAGATTLNERVEIRPKLMRPTCLRGAVKFPALKLQAQELYFLPDAILVVTGRAVAALAYQELNYSNQTVRFIESKSVPRDARVVGNTWQYVNKNGGPDRRFNSNRQLPICVYGEMAFRSDSGMNGVIQYSDSSAGERFSKLMEILRRPESRIESRSISKVHEPKKLPGAIFALCFVSFGALFAALALTSVRPDAASPVQASSEKSSPAAISGRLQIQQSPIPTVASRNSIADPQSLDTRPKLVPSGTQIKRGEETSAGQQSLPFAPSIPQCLSIGDVDERVDCLEAAHAARRQ